MSENKIPGVNMEAGIDLYGGEMDIYISALESFAANTPSVIDLLRKVTEDNLQEYAINVHGLKSVSSTIAAEDISGRAKKLELMAKSGDFSGIMAENDQLLKDTEILVSNIKNWLNNNQ